jgi:1-deoxy-D-xylulose-5-phosphate reductoisomerase
MQAVKTQARPAPAAARAPRRLSILGATGSIGSSTIDLVRRDRAQFEIEAISANTNALELAKLARELGARIAVVADPASYGALKEALTGSGIEAAAGPKGLVEAAERPADWIMAAITGSSGLEPTLAALAQGKTVAVANKECLVCAGTLFMRSAAEAGATVLPVDSEHNAVFQALTAGQRGHVRRITITASGGPFRTWTQDEIRAVTPQQALKHPNWVMGAKVTIDSATLMNKGLEVIEAHYLFQIPSAEIEVLVHPQSIVHGMVEFCDGSMIAALGAPDMRIPIAHCLAWPERLNTPVARLDLAKAGMLAFEQPDTERFPALRLAREALDAGNGAPTVLNAANEVAVAEFLGGRIGFTGIPALVEAAVTAADRRGLMREPETVEEALALDGVGRALAREALPEIAANAL